VTLVPHFAEFLPAWVARQAWFGGSGVPALRPIGFIRLEDPDGQVGMETHLVTDGTARYQIPMTYRGAAIPDAELIATAEHSVLGPRWIYDATTDPVWIAAMIRMAFANGASKSDDRAGFRPAEARGRLLAATPPDPDNLTVRLRRLLEPGRPADAAGAVGVVTGTWYPDGPDSPPARGWLATIHPK
jgi:maltokinase-like protein